MKENRTSKVLASGFKSRNLEKGYISSRIYINNNSENKLRESFKAEAELRNEIQLFIKKMVEKKESADEIKKHLNQDKYKAYEQYFDRWIQDWIIKTNPDIKLVLTKGLNANKKEHEIIEEMQQLNNEIYELYGTQLKDKIRNQIQTKELWEKQEEMRRQEKMKRQKEKEER